LPINNLAKPLQSNIKSQSNFLLSVKTIDLILFLPIAFLYSPSILFTPLPMAIDLRYFAI